MHTMQGLLWEQWRQSRLWIVASGAFLIMMTFGVWMNHDWIMRHSSNDPFELDKLAWIIGFTAIGLLFVNQRIREVTLQFPRRQFVLPCGTLSLVASHLLFKSLIAVVLGGLIAFYHSVLFAQPQPAYLAIALLLALVASVQALVMLAAIFGPWQAIITGGATAGAALYVYFYLNEAWRLEHSEAAAFTSLVLIAAGWSVSLACGPAARYGRAGSRAGAGMSAWGGGRIVPRLARPVEIQWVFTAPLWAQCWYEWRQVLVWVPRVLAPSALLCSLVGLTGETEFALVMLLACSVAAASTCSYFLLRVTPADARFLLARPEGGRVLADGKLLSALVTALAGTAVTGTVIVLSILAAEFLGERNAAEFMVDTLPWFLLLQAAIIWIALTSAPIYLAGMVLWVAVGLPVVVPLTGLGSSDLAVFAFGWIYLAVLFALAWAAVRWLWSKRIPIPWELGLVALTLLPEFLLYVNYPLPYVEWTRIDQRIGFLAPLFLLLGGLLFSRRIGLISGRRVTRTLLGYLFVLVVVLMAIRSGVEAGPITASDVVFWWIAACFAPAVWVPLAVRLQRFR